jgi:transposase
VCVGESFIWKLRTGEAWYNLPSSYPSHQTCYRYHRIWKSSGLLDEVCRKLGEHLRASGGFDLYQAMYEDHTIDFVASETVLRVETTPQYPDTWQASTTWLILSLTLLKHKPKKGSESLASIRYYNLLKSAIRRQVEYQLSKRL